MKTFQPLTGTDPNCIAIVSGGLDSVTLLYYLVKEQHRPHVLTFDYAQRHKKEITAARSIAVRLQLPWDLIDLRDVGDILAERGAESSLVNPSIPVPEGHYAAETMRQTIVPNRNMMMLAIAASICIAEKGRFVATAVHAGDHHIYPDCRAPFLMYLQEAVHAGNEGFMRVGWHFYTPFIHWTKADIAREAHQLGVPIAETWSCYVGSDKHCGRCGTCVERQEALHDAGVPDPTEYTDAKFWKTQVR